MKKNSFKISISVIMGVMLMLALFGCGKQKYKLILPSGFESGKTSYAPGEEVTVSYDIIATDTDYSFYCDADDMKQGYTDKDGYVFSFIMPERDVRFWKESYNSMESYAFAKAYTEEELAEKIDGERMVFDYYDAVTGTDGGDEYTEYVLYRWSEYDLLLARYTKFWNEDEVTRVCRVPKSYLYDCLRVVARSGMREWKDGIVPTGCYIVVKFKEGDEILRFSSDDMPEDGFKAFGDIEKVMREAWSIYGPGKDETEPGIGIIDDPVIVEEEK